MSEYKDDLEDLEYALAWARSGWHCHENPETGAVAIFPETAKDVDDWEARAIAQAEESVRQGIANALPPKPEENVLKERLKIRRGD